MITCNEHYNITMVGETKYKWHFDMIKFPYIVHMENFKEPGESNLTHHNPSNATIDISYFQSLLPLKVANLTQH